MAAEIQRNNGGAYCGECGVPCCDHIAGAMKSMLSAAPPPLLDQDIDDLKSICLSNREGPAFYKDDYHFSRVGAAAARILARHGIRASVDPRQGTISFT